MLPYYIMLGVPVIMYILYGGTGGKIQKQQKKQAVVMTSFFIILLAILMLRHKSVGTDISTYIARFKYIARMSFDRIFEVFESERGYYVLNKIISIFTKNEQWFLVIMALISVIPVAVLYSKESENALLSISIFIIISNFAMLFSGLRQSVAIAIIVISYYFVKNKKPVWFILFVLLAFTFHKSALIALLLYPFYHMNITRKKLLFFIPVIGFVFVFNKPIFEFLLQFLGEYGEDYQYEETGAYMMIILFALFLLLSYIAPSEESLDKETIGLRGIAVLTLMLQIFALASTVAMRMNYYFMVFMPILIPRVLNRCSEKNKQIYQLVSVIITIFFIIYYIYGMHEGKNTLHMYPYRPFWK